MKRVLAFPLVRLVLMVATFAALAVPLALVHGPPNIWRSITFNWLLVAWMIFAAMFVVERLTVRKSPAAIGLDPTHAVRDLFLGAVLGAALFSTVVLLLSIGGFYHVAAIHVTRGLITAALLLLPSAAIEELLFRGVIFRLVEEWTGTWIALAVSAAIFGAAHAANPGATWLSSIAIALEAGVLLGAAFVVTRNLWFPIGLHFAWNFFEGPVFGTQISGRHLLTSAVTAHVAGPAIITGGSFGPEAGLAAIVPCVLAALVLLVVAIRDKRIVPAKFMRSKAFGGS
jgi:uncharacterized protein